MLIKCKECELQVSDKAISCPHCGYPINSKITHVRTKKRMRLPNGFGQITEIKNQNLRNRYRAMITVGKTETGKPICKLLKPNSYFPTYNDAYNALMEYHKNPYDIDKCMIMSELYEKWSEEYFKTLSSDASIRTIKSAWSYCGSIYNMNVADVRVRHVKGCIDNGSILKNGKQIVASACTKSRIKSVLNLMLDYAVEYELVDKNYARLFNISESIIKESETVKQKHIPFTELEMNKLWNEVINMKYVDVLLIQCYTGLRPRELGLIKLKDVDLNNWTITGGIKTEAGTNRVIPIHKRIQPLIVRKVNEARLLNSEYLINCTDSTDLFMSYDKYNKRFLKIVDKLQLDKNHRSHDGRIHFVTMAKHYEVDEYAIKYIIGHAINDLTERVYTHRTIEWLTSEINKIV